MDEHDEVASPGVPDEEIVPPSLEIAPADVVIVFADGNLGAIEAFPTVELGAGPREPAPPPRDLDLLEAVRTLGDRVERGLEALRSTFDREIRAEATREKVVDRLHAELQEYKQDLLLQTLRPVFLDLIQLHDDIGKMADAPLTDAADALARFRTILLDFQQGIEDILYRQGVEPFAIEGEAFDPRRQRAVTTVATEDPTLAKTIASRLRKGFLAGDRVIRPEIVAVHALRKPAPPAAPMGSESDADPG